MLPAFTDAEARLPAASTVKPLLADHRPSRRPFDRILTSGPGRFCPSCSTCSTCQRAETMDPPRLPGLLAPPPPSIPDVRAAMLKHAGGRSYGNPSPACTGRDRAAANLIRACPACRCADGLRLSQRKRSIFTSGATEADNLALFGVLRQPRTGPGAPDHQCQSNTTPSCMPPQQLEREGYSVTYLPVDQQGQVDPAGCPQGDPAKRPALVSVMLVNNEVGTTPARGGDRTHRPGRRHSDCTRMPCRALAYRTLDVHVPERPTCSRSRPTRSTDPRASVHWYVRRRRANCSRWSSADRRKAPCAPGTGKRPRHRRVGRRPAADVRAHRQEQYDRLQALRSQSD
ncbi:MAG: aminotransferase class V-fold PLP-dependent enzyme [Candidatus Moduliflexus flocculans]|nr:aminotransferase class V-fold PLP-dependent enzyme [Candidatus Moduliflexus flocculans]